MNKVIVTEEMLDIAIYKSNRSHDICSTCVMTVAVRSATGDDTLVTAGESAFKPEDFHKPVYKMPGSGFVMNKFDHYRYSEIRGMLPLEFDLIPVDAS